MQHGPVLRAAFLIVLVAAPGCRGCHVVEVEAARPADTGAARAWFPSLMPDDAVEVTAARDEDTGVIVGRFRLDPGAALARFRDLRVVEDGRVLSNACRSTAFRTCERPPWWPAALDRTPLRATDVRKQGYIVVSADDVVYAVDSTTGGVLFWR